MHRLYGLALVRRLPDVQRHHRVGIDTGGDLDRDSIVVAELHLSEMEHVVFDDGHEHLAVAKDQRFIGDQRRAGRN